MSNEAKREKGPQEPSGPGEASIPEEDDPYADCFFIGDDAKTGPSTYKGKVLYRADEVKRGEKPIRKGKFADAYLAEIASGGRRVVMGSGRGRSPPHVA